MTELEERLTKENEILKGKCKKMQVILVHVLNLLDSLLGGLLSDDQTEKLGPS
jgi:hypothetical protein